MVEGILLVVLSYQGKNQVACLLYNSIWLKVGERTVTDYVIGTNWDGLMCAGRFMRQHRFRLDLVLRFYFR